MSKEHPVFLFLASDFKGNELLEVCKELGCYNILIVREKKKDQPWAHHALDEFHTMPSLIRQPDITNAVSYLARHHDIDRIIALDDYDIETAAELREHLRLPGMGASAARFFRDKLAMRIRAREAGIREPEFTPVFPHARLAEFLGRVPPPWVLKPRDEAGSQGIKKLNNVEEVWQTLEQLGDQQAHFHLEQYVPGNIEIFHVDSIVWEGEILFSTVSVYGAPPLVVAQGGGVFTTRLVDRNSPDAKALAKLNKKLLKTMGMTSGVNHAEFIKSLDTGQFYFLEVAARVGGAHIGDMLEQGTGIQFWKERGKIEVAQARGETYHLPEPRQDYAGLIICLSKYEYPDLSAYNDPEVVWRLGRPFHAGLIVRSQDAERVRVLLQGYKERFANDFLTSVPLPEKGRV
ncbi:MAG: ATPase [Anaerolineales bacterium]